MKNRLAWDHAWGGLVNMAYKRDDITVLYSSAGDALGLSDRSILSQAIVMKYRDGMLSDQTAAFRTAPLPYIPLKTSDIHTFSLSSQTVRPSNSFSIGITGAHDAVVKIAYIIDNGPTQVFDAHFDRQGQSRFNVTGATRRGVYRFCGFQDCDENIWIQSTATITVE